MAYAEAEAEADPYLLYGGDYCYGLGHYGYARGYARTYAAYSGYPYAGRLWKREAEAEPEAEADPYLLYGGSYGYGLGHYGYAGHAYAPYAYRAYSGYPYAARAYGYSAYPYGYGYRSA